MSTTTRPTAQDMIRMAESQLGTREGANNRTKYGEWYAQASGQEWAKNSAWCASFQSWCADQIGALGSIIPMHIYTPAGLAWFKRRGLVTRGGGARVGDLVYIYFPSMGRVAHVALVTGVSGGYITTIEGNTNAGGSREGHSVLRRRRRITSSLYFAHPQWASRSTADPASQAAYTKAAAGPVLQRGSTGEPVRALQRALNAVRGLDLDVDGEFGDQTHRALVGFQTYQTRYRPALDRDGVLGRHTRAALSMYGQTV